MIPVDYFNAFIDSAIETLNSEEKMDLVKDKIQIKEGPFPSFDINIIISISKGLIGQVSFSFTETFARHLVKTWCGVTAEYEINKYLNATVGELGNIISGTAIAKLSKYGKEIIISPPLVITGKNIVIDYLKLKTISVQLIAPIGKLEINLAIME